VEAEDLLRREPEGHPVGEAGFVVGRERVGVADDEVVRGRGAGGVAVEEVLAVDLGVLREGGAGGESRREDQEGKAHGIAGEGFVQGRTRASPPRRAAASPAPNANRGAAALSSACPLFGPVSSFMRPLLFALLLCAAAPALAQPEADRLRDDAHAHFQSGAYAEAAALLRRVADLRTAAHGAESLEAAAAHYDLGLALRQA